MDKRGVIFEIEFEQLFNSTDKPHYNLMETKFFPEKMTWGTQNIIIDDTIREFITWDTLYDEKRIRHLLQDNDFDLMNTQEVIDDDRVIFVVASKA